MRDITWPNPISVDEGLPPADPTSWKIPPDWESVYVLAWSSRHPGWVTAIYRVDEDFGAEWYMPEWGALPDVTHWLPFPPPPKELPR